MALSSQRGEAMRSPCQDPSILLVDDTAGVRDMLVDLVRSLGYCVDAAECGEEALALFDQGQYEIVLTDLLMPGMSGWDVLEAVRLRDAHMPIIVITGAPVSDALASQAGVAVLKKPVDITALNTTMQRMLNRRWAV